ncbi:FAD-binding oxidoreductase [Nocardiopsis aegyptia]|uniref:FAD/FMN-containing dehydrogenase n=1 Tax=Nocardiopsis aegyptia TaxID=220378 RepID=A0A7Z0JB67_9ACTN|nr:FAD-binding oxidoreductase [Nocardiopsis aegyptia]NYJ36018.1 FAD/FMN-containing dehydrogenase [Nocardiopsis aegyptia]
MAQLKVQPLSDTALAHLRSGFSGEVFSNVDDGFEEARTLFNAMIETRPAVIAQCASTDDVRRGIECAREEGLEIAVRGGGHSVAGMSLTQGGLVIDMRRMHDVTVDMDRMQVRVGGGTVMGQMDEATTRHGLATTGGRVSTTGVGGFILGGGSGWIERKFGLACDNLLSVDLVTAEGDLVHAAADENPELFWALHGGGGNFGVATHMELRLHPMPEFSLGLLLFLPESGPEVARVWRDFMAQAPDEIGGGLIYLVAQPEPFVPEELVGKLVCGVVLTCVGSESTLRDVAAPLLRLGPEVEMVTDMPYADMQKALDDPPGYRNYWSVEHLASMPDPALDAFCARADDMVIPSPTAHAMWRLGGAVGRAETDYPLPWRHSAWAVHPLAIWEDPEDDDQAIRWVRNIRTDMRPWATGDVYLNFTGDEGEARVVRGFGEDNYARLSAVKTEFDPDNVFHRNHNIRPAREMPGATAPPPRQG